MIMQTFTLQYTLSKKLFIVHTKLSRHFDIMQMRIHRFHLHIFLYIFDALFREVSGPRCNFRLGGGEGTLLVTRYLGGGAQDTFSY